MANEVTKDSFQAEVLDSTVPVLVDFYTNWCGPCRALAPAIKELAAEADGKYKVVKVDCEESKDLAVEYNISALPTLVVFKDGKEVRRQQGGADKKTLLEFVTR